MADRLGIYNDALLIAGERSLVSLTEDREPRRLLDQVWAAGGVQACLEEGQWRFAMRTVKLDYDPSMAPDFGYNRAFTKPSDWVTTSAVCSDEYFRLPLLRYFDEAGYWYSDIDTIYVRYISSDAYYGNNMGSWPMSFYDFVCAHFAAKLILKITNDEDRFKKVLGLREVLLRKAKSKAAMEDPTSFPAQGRWTKSRMRYGNRRDGGNTGGSLIG